MAGPPRYPFHALTQHGPPVGRPPFRPALNPNPTPEKAHMDPLIVSAIATALSIATIASGFAGALLLADHLRRHRP